MSYRRIREQLTSQLAQYILQVSKRYICVSKSFNRCMSSCIRNSPISLIVKLWPVPYTSIQSSYVDEVEAAWTMDPFGFDIIDFEVQVGWYIIGLRRREVVSNNRCAWESICHIAKSKSASKGWVIAKRQHTSPICLFLFRHLIFAV